jgi:hypothetical protein
MVNILKLLEYWMGASNYYLDYMIYIFITHRMISRVATCLMFSTTTPRKPFRSVPNCGGNVETQDSVMVLWSYHYYCCFCPHRHQLRGGAWESTIAKLVDASTILSSQEAVATVSSVDWGGASHCGNCGSCGGRC